jgi:acetoacetyl-CoA synthetase
MYRMQADVLWQPSEERRTQSNLYRFALATQARHGCKADDYDGLHRWSIADPGGFWSTVWDAAGVIGSMGEPALGGDNSMLGRRFFPGARLNFAENLLRHTGLCDAIVYRAEDQLERRVSWDQLRAQVSQLQQPFAADGLGTGDMVVAMLPNLPDAIVALLATAPLGAKWASCSPDFGVQGALDRFGQLDPRLLLVTDSY